MNLKYLYLLLLISGMFASCNESQTRDLPSTETTIIQQPEVADRPAEIEVIDLTQDVPLFLVIAGSYSSEKGAKRKVIELKEAGFANAGVIKRDDSKLYSAFAERFDSEASAKAFSKQIATDNQIKSYVYKLVE